VTVFAKKKSFAPARIQTSERPAHILSLYPPRSPGSWNLLYHIQ